MTPPRVAGKRWLDEHDRDVFEAELMYDAWLEGQIAADETYYFRRYVGEWAFRDGYDERDPYDRLKSEGGHLGE